MQLPPKLPAFWKSFPLCFLILASFSLPGCSDALLQNLTRLTGQAGQQPADTGPESCPAGQTLCPDRISCQAKTERCGSSVPESSQSSPQSSPQPSTQDSPSESPVASPDASPSESPSPQTSPSSPTSSASSSATAPPACPVTSPVLCSDGSCHKDSASCPCPADAPFRCSDGSCQSKITSCPAKQP